LLEAQNSLRAPIVVACVLTYNYLMGNCGSSLDCTKCYSTVPIEGCETELKINADVAGIGVSKNTTVWKLS